MMNNYKEYLEEIKKKLDSLNKISGFDPELKKSIINQNNAMPPNEIFDMLGAGAKLWMDKQKSFNNTQQ